MISLGIETSCDETSAALVKAGRIVLSCVTASSLRLHQKHKGIIPEIASRAHIECISLVVSQALKKAKKKISDIDLICVTKGPGLVGSLLVGISFAKSVSFALNKPLIGVHHLEAHLYANFLSSSSGPAMPFVGLVVSGGHTSLFLVNKDFNFSPIGSTLDDAAGEAFDKVAKILGLGYPGGPVMERLALRGDARKAKFSCRGSEGLDFSFSGIKTAVLYKVEGRRSKVEGEDIAAGFQKAVVDVLIEKSFRACSIRKVNTLVVGGGVACNNYLREKFQEQAGLKALKVHFPEKEFTLDNAAMIAGLGYQMYKRGKRSNYYLTVEM